MANKINRTAAQKAKIAALKPILDKWNEVHLDSWKIIIPPYASDGITIAREKPYDGISPNIHGCLVTDIAGICNAYGWCWAIYKDDENHGISVNI